MAQQHAAGSTYAILQTGRLGDLWFTIPLADHLASQGHTVEVWYDRAFGNVFEYVPSITPHPCELPRVLPGEKRLARVANAAAQQLLLYVRMKLARRRIVWNQIYPWRLAAFLQHRPYPEYWYRSHRAVTDRRARTTLAIANEETILYFNASVSLRIGTENAYAPWLERNLEALRAFTGYRILYVAPPGAPDHPKFETWRGDLSAYQRLVARCGAVYGISTSAHVLAQLLGKPVFACYVHRDRIVDTIGNETARLFPGDDLRPQAHMFAPS